MLDQISGSRFFLQLHLWIVIAGYESHNGRMTEAAFVVQAAIRTSICPLLSNSRLASPAGRDASCGMYWRLAKTCSIGFRSGEQGGRKRRRAPAALLAVRIAAPLWLSWLPITTMPPGACRQGRVGGAFDLRRPGARISRRSGIGISRRLQEERQVRGHRHRQWAPDRINRHVPRILGLRLA